MDVGTLIDSVTGVEDKIVFMEQFVHNVNDFSSQYGSDLSISYTAYNLPGKPSKYPDYGDFPQAFVMRTYGKWWKEAPSRIPEIMPQNLGPIVSEDYIDISFEVPVYPFQVHVYEIFNPGAVVRIWAGDGRGKWALLWEGEAQTVRPMARIFSPPLQTINFPTSLLRLEFDHSNLEYYTELDAVLLLGTRQPVSFTVNHEGQMKSMCRRPSNRQNGSQINIGDITSKVQSLNLMDPDPAQIGNQSLTSVLDQDFPKLLREIEEMQTATQAARLRAMRISSSPVTNDGRSDNGSFNCLPVSMKQFSALESEIEEMQTASKATGLKAIQNSSSAVTNDGRSDNGSFNCLPNEAILHILRYLDLKSLCRCTQINRHFRVLASDALLYTEIGLRPYWSCLNSTALIDCLSTRCKFLQKLDLSWCGNYGLIQPYHFISFLIKHGHTLTNLRVNSCKFITSHCLKIICSSCPNLKELGMASNVNAGSEGFEELAKLKSLERLNLYRTLVNKTHLIEVLPALPNLKHLNLGSCMNITSMDDVVMALSKWNQQIVSLDLWKSYTLTNVGLRELRHCKYLEELDVGWCLNLGPPGNSMCCVARGCPRLRKLFMSSVRSVQDVHIEPFIKCCPNLEQVDLLGCNVNTDIVNRLLQDCKFLRLLDLSFCDRISGAQVELWRHLYPKVQIKRSFQTDVSAHLPRPTSHP